MLKPIYASMWIEYLKRLKGTQCLTKFNAFSREQLFCIRVLKNVNHLILEEKVLGKLGPKFENLLEVQMIPELNLFKVVSIGQSSG